LASHRSKKSKRSKSKSKSKSKAQSKLQTKVAQNKWAQLFFGAILGATGKASDTSSINKCLPTAWQVVDSGANKNSVQVESNSVEEVLNVLSQIINFVCKFKDQIKGLFKKD